LSKAITSTWHVACCYCHGGCTELSANGAVSSLDDSNTTRRLEMHDIDRTQPLLRQAETYELSFESEEAEAEGTGTSPISEAEAMELTSELLEIQSEQDLEYFLGDIVNKIGGAVRGAARAAGDFAATPVGQQVVGMLKQAAKAALPTLGGAVGGYFGGPAGASIGSAAAGQLGQALGLETEGLSFEDEQFEVAQQFVKLAGAAAQNAASLQGAAPPAQVAKSAFVEAAKTFAPGLIKPAMGTNGTSSVRRMDGAVATAMGRGGRMGMGFRQSGRWYRRGNTIVLVGA
jgi:hypothetical protein